MKWSLNHFVWIEWKIIRLSSDLLMKNLVRIFLSTQYVFWKTFVFVFYGCSYNMECIHGNYLILVDEQDIPFDWKKLVKVVLFTYFVSDIFFKNILKGFLSETYNGLWYSTYWWLFWKNISQNQGFWLQTWWKHYCWHISCII